MKFNSVEVVQLLDKHLRDLESLPRANEIIEENKDRAILDRPGWSENVWKLRRMGCKKSLLKVLAHVCL